MIALPAAVTVISEEIIWWEHDGVMARWERVVYSDANGNETELRCGVEPPAGHTAMTEPEFTARETSVESEARAAFEAAVAALEPARVQALIEAGFTEEQAQLL